MRAIPFSLVFLMVINSSAHSLSLKESVRLMLRNDFDLQLADSSTKEKHALVEKSLGEFDWNLSGAIKTEHSETPSSSSLDGVSSAVISDTRSLSPTLSKKSMLGTELSFPASWTQSESNSSYSRIPTGYNTSLGVKLTQPLMRGFDSGYFAKSFEKAQSDLKTAQLKYGDQVGEHLKKTLSFYLDALKSQKALQIKQQSLEHSTETYEAAKAKHSVGKASLIDVMDAESGKQRAQDAYLTAKSELQADLEQLAMKVFGNPMQEVQLTDEIGTYLQPPEDYNLEQLFQEAAEHSPEIKISEVAVAQAERDLGNAVTDQRPDVKFEGSLTYKGLDESWNGSHQQIANREHQSYSMGLKWDHSLNRSAAKAELKVKALRRQQEKIKKRQMQQNVALTLKKAVRDIQTHWARITALQNVVQAENEKFEGQQQRFAKGRISVFELNEALTAKENSALELLKAQIFYLKARFDLANTLGKLDQDLGI